MPVTVKLLKVVSPVMVAVLVDVKLTVELFAVNVPLFDQLPPTLIVLEPEATNVPAEIVRSPPTVVVPTVNDAAPTFVRPIDPEPVIEPERVS